MSGGNPNHDPRTGEFVSGGSSADGRAHGAGANAPHRSVGHRIAHGAKVVAKAAGIAAGVALAAGLGAAVTMHRMSSASGGRQGPSQTPPGPTPARSRPPESLNARLATAHMKTLSNPQVRAAHQMGLINPRKKRT